MLDKKIKQEIEDKYLNEMIGYSEMVNDTEGAHIRADKLLIKIMRELGFEFLMDVYEDVPKWYS